MLKDRKLYTARYRSVDKGNRPFNVCFVDRAAIVTLEEMDQFIPESSTVLQIGNTYRYGGHTIYEGAYLVPQLYLLKASGSDRLTIHEFNYILFCLGTFLACFFLWMLCMTSPCTQRPPSRVLPGKYRGRGSQRAKRRADPQWGMRSSRHHSSSQTIRWVTTRSSFCYPTVNAFSLNASPR